jgi:subtilisin family serine protease
MVGGAYEADFLLAKTEDVSQETTLEEDYMVEALEWGEGLGADIVSGSLGYTEFDDSSSNYTYEDMDGNTAISTLGIKHAAYLGVLCVYAMGNSGNDAWHYISAPADADSIISVGAVDISNNIAGFSSFGPSYDGRIKPEVVALGVSNFVADAYGGYSSWGSGTSYATPLVAAASAVVLSAHPEWSAMEVREALMMTADRNEEPSIDRYGYGLIDAVAAINYTQSTIIEENIVETNRIISAYPNPFNPTTTINFDINEKGLYNISIFNIGGKQVSSQNNSMSAGSNSIQFDGRDLVSGIYTVMIKRDGVVLDNHKVTLIK